LSFRTSSSFKFRIGPWTVRSESAFAVAVGAVVVLALFVALNPETRLFLMFIDSFGIDLFASLCVLYVRDHLTLCIALLIIPALKGIYGWGPVPGFWPSKIVIKSSLSWAAYAVLYPAAALLVAALLFTLAFSGVRFSV
jgi:hypothetical protein